MLDVVYGKASLSGSTLILDADQERAKRNDGIGCCLAFMPWDGAKLSLDVELVRQWWPHKWADLWFVTRPAGYIFIAGANRPKSYPLRYARFRENCWEVGIVNDGTRQGQVIVATGAREGRDERQRFYTVSQQGKALNIYWSGQDETVSLFAPRTGELGLYCEASIVKLQYERAEG